MPVDMEQAGAYQPRRQTWAEIMAEDEEAKERKERLRQTVENERRRAKEAAFSFKQRVTSSGDIAFVDHVLGSGRATLSRSQMDRKEYLQARNRRRQSEGDEDESCPACTELKSLKRIAISAFAQNWAQPGMLDGLTDAHRIHTRDLLDELKQLKHPPWNVWLALVERFSLSDIPKRFRTMRDVALSDKNELERLPLLNQHALERYATMLFQPSPTQLVQSPPSFILTTLDLRHDTLFYDTDVHKLRIVAESLVVLALSYTNVTDLGVRNIVTLASDDDHQYFRRLEVLLLRGLGKNLTDKAAVSLSQLPSLRMLDVRNTSCTSALGSIMNGRVKADKKTRWRPARYNGQLGQRIDLELQLFGKSCSLSRILTNLHELAEWEHGSDAKVRPVKPVTVCIESVVRIRPVSTGEATEPGSSGTRRSSEMESVYYADLGKGSGPVKAAYHQAFGAITCTSTIDAHAVQLNGTEATQKTAAFRVKGESVAMGAKIGHTRRVESEARGMEQQSRTGEMVDWSDYSDDEREMAEFVEKRATEWPNRMNEAGRTVGKDQQEKKSKIARPVEVAKVSELMLVRHLPLRHPCEPALPMNNVIVKGSTVDVKDGKMADKTNQQSLEAGEIMQKRRKVDASEKAAEWKAKEGVRRSLVPQQSKLEKAGGRKLGGLKRSFG